MYYIMRFLFSSGFETDTGQGCLINLGYTDTDSCSKPKCIHHTQGDSPRMVIRLRCNLICLRSKKEKEEEKEREKNGNVTQGLRGQYYFRYRGFSSGQIQPGGSIIEALSAEARSSIQQPPGFERKGIEETGTLEQSVLVGMLYLALSQL